MIEDSLYKGILENGLLLDHYFLLCKIKNSQPLVQTKRVQGFVNLMVKKGYISDDGELTPKGIDLVRDCEFSQPIALVEQTTQRNIDFGTWVVELHKKCQDEIKALTGLLQVRPKLLDKSTGRKKAYPFLCNATDLGTRLTIFLRTYKTKDYELIESTILRYIRECAKSNEWFPLLEYYIIKEGRSKLMTDMESNEEEPGTNSKNSQKFL